MERCDGCGFVWDLVPIAESPPRIAETASVFRRLLMPPDRPGDWATRVATRPAPDVWSALEYACHVRDVLFVQRDRLYLTLVEDVPTFAPMYREERVPLARYADEDLGEVVAQVEMAARLFARSVAVLPRPLTERRCVYLYPEPAERTLAWLAAQTLHEMVHHVGDIAGQVAPHESRLDAVRSSPREQGRLDMIVIRPAVDERTVLSEATLSVVDGVVGDNWRTRGSKRTTDGFGHPEMQLNLMNSRAAAVVCGVRDRWALAGDQLIVDFDLSTLSCPPGTRLAIGDAVIEVTAIPHRGCPKFSARFGQDALRLVNSAEGRALNLRGINAKVVTGGTIRQGDPITRI